MNTTNVNMLYQMTLRDVNKNARNYFLPKICFTGKVLPQRIKKLKFFLN